MPDFVANGGAAVALTGCGEEGSDPDVARAEARVSETLARLCTQVVAGQEPYAAALALARANLTGAARR